MRDERSEMPGADTPHRRERQGSVPVTVIILTRNEADFIARAMSGVAAWADQVLVVDSESTDATRDIAQRLGADVHVQPWLGWLDQKRVAVDLARNDWILSLDADEIVTEPLGRAMRALFEDRCGPDPRDGFVVERREEFLGALMPNMRRRSKRESFVRLFHRAHGGWNPDLPIHEEIVCPGELRRLDGDLLHWRNYRIGRQLDTLNRNTDVEAGMIANRSDAALLAGMVLRPVLRFGWLYVVCGLWRSGRRGFAMSVLQSISEFLRHAKAWEAKSVPARHDPPPAIWAPPRREGIEEGCGATRSTP